MGAKTFTVTVGDLGEPGAGVDTIEVSGLITPEIKISGGNFQVHDIE